MTYRGHLAGGAAAALVTAELSGATGPALVVGVASVLAGSLAPDIDSPGSYAGRRLLPISYLFRWLVSNPLTWWWAGRRHVTPRRVTESRRFPLLFRLVFYSPLHRGLLGARRALRWATLLEIGRRRMRRLASHRMLTHSLVGVGALAALFGALTFGGLTFLADQAPAIHAHLLTGLTPLPLLSAGPASLATWAGTSFFIGELSHLGLDMMTISGVPLLLPGTDRRFWLVPDALRLRTG